jgi:hypothetical protein
VLVEVRERVVPGGDDPDQAARRGTASTTTFLPGQSSAESLIFSGASATRPARIADLVNSRAAAIS